MARIRLGKAHRSIPLENGSPFTLSSCTVLSIRCLQRARFHQRVYFLQGVDCFLSSQMFPLVISQKYPESQEYGRDFHSVTCEERKGKVVETFVKFSEK